MKLQELSEVEMYVLCAPDGTVQLPTMAPDFPTCVAMLQLTAEKGLSQHPAKMFQKGYTVMPIKVTVTQNGDENKPFQK